MEINQFLGPIRDIEIDPSKYDINKVLFDFQHQINANIFNQLSPGNDLNEIFKTIWRFLLKSSNNPSSNTRISACKAIGTFLTWITPFYPLSIRNSFIEVAKSTTDDTKNSAAIASSYAFISKYLAEPLLPEFITSIESFDQFILNDISSSEHSALIISKFSHFGTEFFTKLLDQFLHQMEEKQDRNLIRAISAILSNDPCFYIQIVLNFVKPQIKSFLSLITFLITAFQDKIRSTVDLMPIAITAIDTIADESSNLADIDSSFQILAIKSDSFSFSAQSTNTMTCDMKITDKKGSEKTATVDLKKIISMPSFYSLNLPLPLLMPDRENDSVPVLSAKLKSIASNEKFDMNEVLSIFEPFFDGSYNEVTSSAIQAFSKCINSILSIVPLKKFHSIVRKVLFTKPANWYHSSDILKVISCIDLSLFKEKMGERTFIELFETLIGFCLCENSSLASDSMKVLTEKMTASEIDKIVSLAVKKCDFFDQLKIDRCVSILTVILTKFTFSDTTREILLYFSQKLIEATPLYYENVNFLCNVFNFFSNFKTGHEKSKNVISAAYNVIFSTVEIITGQPIKSSIKIETSSYFKDLIRNDLASRNVDIITDSLDDQKAFIYPMKCALDFIFKNAPKSGAMIVAMNSYRLFPIECSKFIEDSWESAVSDSEKLEVLLNLPLILKSNNDERLHSTWCRICLKIDQKSETTNYKEIIQFLNKMASNFLSHSEKVEDDYSIPASYIEFYSIFENKEISLPTITNYLNKASPICLREIAKRFPKLFELVPSIKSEEIESAIEKDDSIDSKSETSDQNELKKLPDKIEDNELLQLFEDSVRKSNVRILKEIVKLMSERKMTIDLKTVNLSFPPETVPIVSLYLANYLTFEKEEIDLIKTLRNSRTDWRQYSIEFLKKTDNSNKLIEKLLSIEKVKKNDILCLCSLIGTIEFDNDLLLKLSTKLLFESKKIGRFRVTLKLLTTVISIQTIKITPTFLTSMSTNLSPNIDQVDTEGMSLALLLAAQKVGFPQEMVKFADDIIMHSGHRSTSHGRIIQIYIGISSSFPSVAQKISDVFPELTVSYLQSVLPSRFNQGSRLFEQSVLSLKPSAISTFLARGIDCIVNRYNGISKYPSSVFSATKAILSFISRDGIKQLQIALIKNLSKITLSQCDACFITFVSILNSVLHRFPSNNDFMKKFQDSFFDSMFSKSGFNNGNSFKFARFCLLERLNAIKSEISREKLIQKAVEQWFLSLPNYDQVNQLKSWWILIECHFSMKKAFEVFDFILNKVVKVCGFAMAFPTVLFIYVNCNEKCGNLNEFKKFIENANDLIEKKCQKEAFSEMKKLSKDGNLNDKYKELVNLALSEND